MDTAFVARRMPAALLALLVVIPQAYAVGSWTDLRQLSLAPDDERSELRTSFCPYNCRFDRTSSGDTRFLRQDGEESVIFETFGPGAITRIWMTSGAMARSIPLDPDISMRIYLDNDPVPAFDRPLPAFFDGTTAPFDPPTAYDRLTSSGGNVTFVPIVYQRSARIALTNAVDARIWYQINHERRPEGATVVAPALDDFRAFLSSDAPPPSSETREFVASLRPGQTIPAATVTGPAWITSLRIDPSVLAASDLLVSLQTDGRSRINALPATDLFALGTNDAVNRSRLVGRSEAGNLYLHWPMPIHEQAILTLTNAGAMAAAITVELDIDDSHVTPDALPFHVALRQQCPTVPEVDMNLLSLQGQGRLVGLFQGMQSVDGGIQVLEGDERVYVDGQIQPTWYGTGVEDFYSGGFFFDQGNFSLPLHGQTAEVRASTYRLHHMYRFMLDSSLPFRRSLVFRQEAGPFGDLPMCHRSVTYYYHAPRPLTRELDQVIVGDPTSATLHAYTDGAATCEPVTGQYLDEPPTDRTATVCESTGSAAFRLEAQVPGRPVVLERLVDASLGGQVAEILVNGEAAGTFDPVPANPDRRWFEQTTVLPARVIDSETLQFEIVPRDRHRVVEYRLSGEPSVSVFEDSFEAPPDDSLHNQH